jgi:hypothetical protein
MEGKELRIWKNRQSAEKSRRNKDQLVNTLQDRLNNYQQRIENLKQLNYHYRVTLMNLGQIPDCEPSFSTPSAMSQNHPNNSWESTQMIFLEPAVF